MMTLTRFFQRFGLLLAATAIAFSAAAYDFMVDDIAYDINADGESVTVTHDQNYISATGPLVIPGSVTYGGTTYTVTAIGERAFRYCAGFTSLTIPNTVTTISDWAFAYCKGFTGSLSIPHSVVTIGHLAFYGCSGFTGTLTIGESVSTIGSYAFKDCSGFDKLIYDAVDCGGTSFLENQPFKTLKVNEVVIGDHVKIVPAYFLNDCGEITGPLTIGNSVTTIGENAFAGCSGFTGSLIIPQSVTEIGHCAFTNCSGFESLAVAEGNPRYDSRDNCNAMIETTTNKMIGGIKNFTIPNTVTSIGEYAFRDWTALTGPLTIPNSVTSIGTMAFAFCSGFSGSLVIPESVTTIGYQAFYGCSGLNGSVTIPNSVTSIGERAFAGCLFFAMILTGEGDYHITSGS